MQYFEPVMEARLEGRRVLEYELRRSIDTSQFELHYQPLVNLETNRINSFEALIRWQHPTMVRHALSKSGLAPQRLELEVTEILKDSRHHDVALRFQVMTPELLFSNEWMALRSTDEIAPEIFQRHRYQPGLPVDDFNGNQVMNFITDCFAITPVCA
jgi:hypothetical protein